MSKSLLTVWHLAVKEDLVLITCLTLTTVLIVFIWRASLISRLLTCSVVLSEKAFFEETHYMKVTHQRHQF